jgi:hypothetical protein
MTTPVTFDPHTGPDFALRDRVQLAVDDTLFGLALLGMLVAGVLAA